MRIFAQTLSLLNRPRLFAIAAIIGFSSSTALPLSATWQFSGGFGNGNWWSHGGDGDWGNDGWDRDRDGKDRDHHDWDWDHDDRDRDDDRRNKDRDDRGRGDDRDHDGRDEKDRDRDDWDRDDDGWNRDHKTGDDKDRDDWDWDRDDRDRDHGDHDDRDHDDDREEEHCEPGPIDEGCALYPITFPVEVLESLAVGQSFDIYAGSNSGNFGWLTWAGSPSERAIRQSLEIPGDSHTYINPHDSSDRVPNAGDWVQGKPGISNSRGVRKNLDALIGRPILIPVYGDVTGSGNNVNYEIVDFAEVAIESYRLPSQNRISATFLGFKSCGNQPPMAENVVVVTAKQTSVAIPLEGSDPEGEAVTFSLVDPSANGSIDLVDGVATYTPLFGFIGVDTFTYLVNDGEFDSELATVSITVTNGTPVAFDDALAIAKNTILDITLTTADPDGETLALAIVDEPENGTVSLAGDVATYTPGIGFVGTDQFTFVANDGYEDSNIATVTITVSNEGPTADDKAASTTKNSPVDVTLSGDDPDGDPITFVLASNPANGSVTVIDGIATYTPNAGFSGTDTFTYVSNDGYADSVPATVTITVANGLPVATDVSATTPKNTTVNVTLLGTDPDGDFLVYVLVDDTANGALNFSGDLATYTPDPGFVGTDTFTYRVNDGEGNSNVATGKVTVKNTAPTADSKEVETNYITPINIVLTGSDPDSDPITFTIVDLPANGSFARLAEDLYEYTPSLGFSGTDTFTYISNDGLTNSPLATVSVIVSGGNTPPTAENLTAGTPMNVPVAIALQGSDPDGDSLGYSLQSLPANGVVSLVDDTVTYTPNPGYTGMDSFRYRVFDNFAYSGEATVTVTVQDIGNQPPLAGDIPVTTPPNTPVGITLAATDPNQDPLQYFNISVPVHGSLVDLGGGQYTYTPDMNYTGTDSFQYVAYDGELISNIATVNITIDSGGNEPPVIDAGPTAVYFLDEIVDINGNATFALDGSASDDGLPNPALFSTTWTLVSGPVAAGNVVFDDAAAVDSGVTVSEALTGAYHFRLTATDSVYTIDDEVVINLVLDNEPPIVTTDLTMSVDMVGALHTINGYVSDDGLPLGAALTSEWQVIDGPGTVTITDAGSSITTASFSEPGIYLLEFSADDTEYADSETLTVYVDANCLIQVPNTTVAWWTGNYTYTDLIEGRHSLSAQGDPAFATGKVSLGFLFDGIDDALYALASNFSDLAAPSVGGFAIEGWFDPDLLAAMPLIQWSNGTTTGVSLSMGASGELVVSLPVVGGATIERIFPGVFTAGQFRHVALNYNGATGVLDLYVDGAPHSSHAIGVFRFNTLADIRVGAGNLATGLSHYQGVIDELTLYRGPLTFAQIRLTYLSGSIGKCGDPDAI